MTDFDYEVMQKKRIARGAAHMKRGSKSKKCSLPSDHMTPAEWKRRNGPVSTYKLDAPMSWEQFREMPFDLRKKYLNSLYDLYGASDARIGAMMLVSPPTVARARAELGIHRPGARVGAAELKRREAMWEAFCNGVVGGGDNAESPTEDYDAETVERMDEEPISEGQMEDPDVTEVVEGFKKWSEELPRELMVERAREAIKPDVLSLDKLSVTFSGDFDAESFLRWVTRLPMPDGKVCIKVEVMAL